MNKPFSLRLHNKYDGPARLTTLKYIVGTTDNTDKYGVDILYNGGKFFDKIEVQTISHRNFIYNYKLLTIFKRKDRYSNNTIYITYNHNYTACYIFCRCQLDKDKMKYFNTKYSMDDKSDLYYLNKDDVLIIKQINETNFNIDVLEKFFQSKN